MLHFYYGVMGSSKTAMLLMQRYNCLQQGFKVALVKPAIDRYRKSPICPANTSFTATG